MHTHAVNASNLRSDAFSELRHINIRLSRKIA